MQWIALRIIWDHVCKFLWQVSDIQWLFNKWQILFLFLKSRYSKLILIANNTIWWYCYLNKTIPEQLLWHWKTNPCNYSFESAVGLISQFSLISSDLRRLFTNIYLLCDIEWYEPQIQCNSIHVSSIVRWLAHNQMSECFFKSSHYCELYDMFSFLAFSDLKTFRSLVEEEDQHMKLSLGSSEWASSHLQPSQGWNHTIFTSNTHSSVVLQVSSLSLLHYLHSFRNHPGFFGVGCH